MAANRGSSSIAASAAALAATATAALGFGIAIGIRIASNNGQTPTSSSSKQRQNLCECGFDLTNCPTNQQIDRHMASILHRTNLKRSRGAPILLTAKINEYRAAISTHVDAEDVVLEVGCAEGLTTQRLAQRCRMAIGLDLYERLIIRARRRIGKPPEDDACEKYNKRGGDNNGDGNDEGAVEVEVPAVDAPEGRGWSNLHFYKADALKKEDVLRAVNAALGLDQEAMEEARRSNKAQVDELIAGEMEATSTGATDVEQLSRRERRILRRAAIEKQADGSKGGATSTMGRLHSGKITKIWIDLSGSRETRTVVQAIEQLEALFQPKLIVVKSDKLKNLARRCYQPSSMIPGISHAADNTPYVIN